MANECQRPKWFDDFPFPVAPHDTVTLKEDGCIAIGDTGDNSGKDYLIRPDWHPKAWALLLPLADFEYEDG